VGRLVLAHFDVDADLVRAHLVLELVSIIEQEETSISQCDFKEVTKTPEKFPRHFPFKFSFFFGKIPYNLSFLARLAR